MDLSDTGAEMAGRWRALFGVVALTALLWTLAGCGPAATLPRPTTASPATSPSATTGRPGTVPARQTASPVPDPPADFAFTFASDHCGDRDELDTFAGRFTRYVPPGNNRSGMTTIALVLTADELASVYRRMVAIGFFAYPDALSPTGPVRFAPFSTYEIAARRDGQTKRVHWMTGNPTPTVAETQLAGLVGLVEDIIRARPEIQRLPAGFGCT